MGVELDLHVRVKLRIRVTVRSGLGVESGSGLGLGLRPGLCRTSRPFRGRSVHHLEHLTQFIDMTVTPSMKIPDTIHICDNSTSRSYSVHAGLDGYPMLNSYSHHLFTMALAYVIAHCMHWRKHAIYKPIFPIIISPVE